MQEATQYRFFPPRPLRSALSLKVPPTLQTTPQKGSLPLVSLHVGRGLSPPGLPWGCPRPAAGLLFPSDSLCLRFFPRTWGHGAKKNERGVIPSFCPSLPTPSLLPAGLVC